MRKEWLERNYYDTLGVPKDASEKAIKKAFRKLAQQYRQCLQRIALDDVDCGGSLEFLP